MSCLQSPGRRLYLALMLCIWGLIPLPSLAGPAPTMVTVEVGSGSSDAAGKPRQVLGFLVEAEGFLLTTYQNLTDPDTGLLEDDLSGRVWGDARKEVFPIGIVGVEPTIDLAILKLETDRRFTPSEVLLGAGAEPGLEIFAPTRIDAENPQVRQGRLTGLNSRECYQESLTSTMLRGELAISATAAGAPIYTRDGQVVALYTAYVPSSEALEPERANEVHLLPIALAFNIYESLKQKRSLRSPWTGFSVRALDAEERQLFPSDKGHRGGVAIEAIIAGGPAERMGIRVGDLLVQLGHNRIASVADFQKWLYQYGVGHEVKLVLMRKGEGYLIGGYTIEERPGWARPR